MKKNLSDYREKKITKPYVPLCSTFQIINSYTFKDSDLKHDSFFADSIIDVDPKNCDDAYVYNSDLGGYGLVVYSLAKNDSWRVQHNYFHFEPQHGKYNCLFIRSIISLHCKNVYEE